MGRIVSFRALSDATLARYEAAEKAGTLTPRQASALRSHRGLSGAVQAARQEAEDRALLRDALREMGDERDPEDLR